MTAKHSPLTELMHAVLDGEASAAEARELELRPVSYTHLTLPTNREV